MIIFKNSENYPKFSRLAMVSMVKILKSLIRCWNRGTGANSLLGKKLLHRLVYELYLLLSYLISFFFFFCFISFYFKLVFSAMCTFIAKGTFSGVCPFSILCTPCSNCIFYIVKFSGKVYF